MNVELLPASRILIYFVGLLDCRRVAGAESPASLSAHLVCPLRREKVLHCIAGIEKKRLFFFEQEKADRINR